MTETQAHLLKLTLEIDEICKKHNIQYFLEFGSALGGLRHKGFIPWDNDLDLVMTEENYDKFKEVCGRELDHKTRTFVDNRVDREYPVVFGHYVDMESYRMTDRTDFWKEHCGQCIDIFCMLELPADYEEQKKVRDRFFAYDEFVNRSFNHYKRKTPEIFALYKEYLARAEKNGYNETCLELEKEIFGQHYPDGDLYMMGSARFGGTYPYVPRSAYETAMYVDFEGYKLPIPGDCFETLILYYGDSFSQFPRDKRIHSEMSHTGLPSKAYVDSYMSIMDKDEMLKKRTKLKDKLIENGYRLDELTGNLYRLHKTKIISDLHSRIEEEGIDIDALIKENSSSGWKTLNDLFSDFIQTQTHSSMVYWNIHFGLDDRLETAAMYTMLYYNANYTGIDKLLRVRKHNGLEITDEMKKIQSIVRHIRNINKYMIYKEWDKALENLQWCKDNCPNAKDIDLWDLRLNVSTADSKEDIDRCFEILGSVEKRSGRDTDQYFIKAHADLLWKAGEKDQAKEKYRWLRENSNDGLILMDIAENNRIQSDKGDR